MATSFFQTLRVNLVAALGGQPRLDTDRSSHRDALNAWSSLKRWIRAAVDNSGPLHVAQQLKDFAAACRVAAITGGPVPTTRFHRVFIGPYKEVQEALAAVQGRRGNRWKERRADILTQLSYIGRSLPKGRQLQEGEKALREHLHNLSSPAPELPKDLREEMEAFGRYWADDNLSTFAPRLEFDPTAGACLESSRRQGGLAGFLHRRLGEIAAKYKIDPGRGTPELNAEVLHNWEQKTAEVQALFILNGQANGLPVSPATSAAVERMKASGITRRSAEPGIKYQNRADELLGLASFVAPGFVKKLTTYPVRPDDAALKLHAALADSLYQDLMDQEKEGPMRAQAQVISERGWKVRVVTKSPGALVALAHQVRRWLSEGLRKDRSIKAVLAGDHREAVEEIFPIKNAASKSVLSADLKTATDLISLQTFQAIWKGISHSSVGNTLPPWTLKVMELALGPQTISYPSLPGEPHIRSKRGALMGLPSTWPFLCLANLFWWHSAHLGPDAFRKLLDSKPAERKANYARVRRTPKVRICGDDLIGVTSKEGRERYEENAIASGAKFSGPSKHLFCRSGGVFTEEMFFTEIDTRTAEMSLVRWSEAFPTRGIIGTMRCDQTGRESPYWMSLGPAVEGMMLHRERKARRAILYLIRMVHPELKGFLRRYGLLRLLHVPRQFGGIGIPTETMWSFRVEGSMKEVDRAALVLATSSSWEDDLSALSRPYDTAPSTTLPLRRIAAEQATFVVGGRYRVIKSDAAVPIGWFPFPGTVTDLIDKITGNVARDLFFLSEMEAQPKSKPAFNARSAMTARTLARTLDRARRELISSRGGWLLRSRNKKEEGEEAPLKEVSGKRPASPASRDRDQPGSVAIATPPKWTPSRTIDPRSLDEVEQINLLALSVGMGFTMTELAALPDWERTALLEAVMEQWSQGSPLPPRAEAVPGLVSRLQGAAPVARALEFSSPNETDKNRGENHGKVSFSWRDLLDRISEIENSRRACLIPDEHALEGILGQRFQETDWWKRLLAREKVRARQERRPPPAATPLREMADRSIRDLVSKSLHWPA